MGTTIYGIAKNPGGRGVIEIRSTHANHKMQSCGPTGVVYRTQREGYAATFAKNVEESRRIASVLSGRSAPDAGGEK